MVKRHLPLTDEELAKAYLERRREIKEENERLRQRITEIEREYRESDRLRRQSVTTGKGDTMMQTQDRVWKWGLYTITVTPRAIRYDATGVRHETVALSEITSADRKSAWPFSTLVIKHRGGKMVIRNISTGMAKEIIAAIGF